MHKSKVVRDSTAYRCGAHAPPQYAAKTQKGAWIMVTIRNHEVSLLEPRECDFVSACDRMYAGAMETRVVHGRVTPIDGVCNGEPIRIYQ